MYSSQFACAIKVNGTVLRESAGAVAIPFGSEYSIYLKNLATVRAMAKVEIDGTDITGETWLVIAPNSSMDLERFIRNGNWDSGNRLKFIKRTGKVEAARGIKAEDGLVRIEYKFEKMPDPEVHTHHYHHNHWPTRPYYWDFSYYPYYPYYDPSYSWTTTCGGIASCSTVSVQSFNVSKAENMSKGGNADAVFNNSASILRGRQNGTQVSYCASQEEVPGDPGITVPGSESNQKFHLSGWFQTEEQSHILIIKLMGTVGGRKVVHAVTVKTKARCATCATVNKAGVKFCKECGTSLEII